MKAFKFCLISLILINNKCATIGDRFRSSANKCSVTLEKAEESMQSLLMVGDPYMSLPINHCEVLEHCDKIQENALRLLKFSKECVETHAAKTLFTLISRTFMSEYKKRCINRDWRESYINFSKKLKNTTAKFDIHQCAYKVSDALQYVVDNYAGEEQMSLSCCGMQLIQGCVHDKLIKDFGDEIADFAPALFWQPIAIAIDWSCPGLDSPRLCRKHYPNEMKLFDKIVKNKKKLTPRNFMKWAFKMHQNRGHRLPESPVDSNEK